MMKPFAIALMLCCSVAAWLQAVGNESGLGFDKRLNGREMLDVVEPVRDRLQRGSAAFFVGRDVVAYGLVVREDGYIVTKASELADKADVYARVGEQKFDRVELVGSDEASDLALVRVEAHGLYVPPVDERIPELGTVVVSNGSSTRYARRARIGLISGNPRAIPSRDRDVAYLGVAFAQPCGIERVVEDSPAQKAGVRAGDVVVEIEQTPVHSLEQIGPLLNDKKPGDLLSLKVQRGKRTLEMVLTLGSRLEFLGEESLPKTRNDVMSGYVSRRRDGFAMALEHDSPLSPTSMGGPLLDLRGHVRGINIARYNRAETFALPIGAVNESWKKLLAGTEGPQ